MKQKLGQLCGELFDRNAQVKELTRLSGGANMESWSFRYGDLRLVLRRRPGGSSEATDLDDNLGVISLAAQAELIETAARGGVTVPAVLGRLRPEHGLGEGFLMAKIEGQTLPHKILGQPEYAGAEAGLTQQCARELALIHALDPTTLPAELCYKTPLELVQEQELKYRQIAATLPVFDFAFGWLRRNAPAATEPTVLHGDFRMGNLIIDSAGISAVLDWELAHLGDPAQDIAYLCTPSWRFGHYDKPVGGFDQIGALLAAYREQSGRDIEPARLQYWLIFSTLWWGMVCLAMGELWRSGGDRSLERAVIGRRVSEVETDLLLQFEDVLALSGSNKLNWKQPDEVPFHGEIDYPELATALGEWNKQSVQEEASGHQLFEARVAGNAMGILQRQARWEGAFRQASTARLAAMGLDRQGLCRALCEQQVRLEDDAVWDHLRLSALERMVIDQPRYSGFHCAIQQWCA
jgi:aminoglycoside phosphotransferase (APT) family kinase protein